MSERSKALLEALKPRFEKCGYKLRKSAEEFLRRAPNGNVRSVTVGLIRTRPDGSAKISTHCHIRIEEIENIYVKYRPNLSEKDQKKHYTINVNCDNLYPNGTAIVNSMIIVDDTIAEVGELARKAIHDYVLPFLDKYTDKEILVENMMSEDVMERITSDPVSRFAILMTDAVQNDDRPAFEAYGQAFLKLSARAEVYLPMAESIYRGLREEYFG